MNGLRQPIEVIVGRARDRDRRLVLADVHALRRLEVDVPASMVH
jgi:hypothetical protein